MKNTKVSSFRKIPPRASQSRCRYRWCNGDPRPLYGHSCWRPTAYVGSSPPNSRSRGSVSRPARWSLSLARKCCFCRCVWREPTPSCDTAPAGDITCTTLCKHVSLRLDGRGFLGRCMSFYVLSSGKMAVFTDLGYYVSCIYVWKIKRGLKEREAVKNKKKTIESETKANRLGTT